MGLVLVARATKQLSWLAGMCLEAEAVKEGRAKVLRELWGEDRAGSIIKVTMGQDRCSGNLRVDSTQGHSGFCLRVVPSSSPQYSPPNLVYHIVNGPGLQLCF